MQSSELIFSLLAAAVSAPWLNATKQLSVPQHKTMPRFDHNFVLRTLDTWLPVRHSQTGANLSQKTSWENVHSLRGRGGASVCVCGAYAEGDPKLIPPPDENSK